MKVHLLQQAISHFISEQLKSGAVEWYYPHSMISTFQNHWILPKEESLSDIYDSCLKSEYTQRWWKRDQYQPKEIMLQLIEADAELATIAWKDLFNANTDIEGRLSRFEFYCEDLLRMYRKQQTRSVETYHHQDATIISLYLAGRFPDQYTLYPGLEAFQFFCKAIGSPDIPAVDDLIRYMKVANVVFTFLKRDEQFEKLLAQRTSVLHKEKIHPFQISYELISFEAMRFKMTGR